MRPVRMWELTVPRTALTRDLGAFVADFRDEVALTIHASMIKSGWIDAIGAMLAGSTQEGAQILRRSCIAPSTEASI